MGVVTLGLLGKPPVQVYVLAPLAVRFVEFPVHILGEFTLTVGFGLTVTVTASFTMIGVEQVVFVTIAVYVVVVVGHTLTDAELPTTFPP
jgi:hypothetical protein